jgi:hypothetical protein
MMLHPMKVLAMPKILLCLVLASLSVLAAAQTPVKPAKPLVQPVAKSSGKTSASAQAISQAQARAAAEATAQVQAQAIAQAAASARNLPSAPTQPSSATVESASNAALRPASVMVPAYPAPLALPVSPTHSPAALTSPPTTVADSALEPTALADPVHQGHLPCEMGASVQVEADIAKPGYFNVMSKGFKYHMQRVRTSTGAIRLEDAKAGVVWLQLANKSMLMDQKKGRRVADECAHPDQVAYAKSMKTNPPSGLFDTAGMGRPKN